MNSFILMAAKKKILRNKRLLNCLILVALVCAPIVAAISFSDSMMDGIANKYVYLSGGHILVNDDFDVAVELENYIKESQKVCYSGILLCSENCNLPLQIKGVNKSYFNEERLSYIDIEGEKDSILDGIVISKSVADNLSLKIGDKVAAIIISENNGKTHPVMTVVSGLYSTGYKELDNSCCFASLEMVSSESGSDICTELIVKNSYSNNLRSVQKLINAESTTWISRNSAMYANFVNSKQLIVIVMLVIVLMSAFYCSSVAQQFIQDDAEELSLYRMLGADSKSLTKICFISVFAVTLSGIIIGFFLGCTVTYLFVPVLKFLNSLSLEVFSYYLLDFRIIIPFKSVISVLGLMVCVSALAILLSLRKAKRITPLQFFNQ